MDEEHLDFFPEAQAQIAWADTVVMTQTDLADYRQIAQINQRLDQLAPTATRLTAVQGEVDPDELLNLSEKFRRLRDENLPDLPEHGLKQYHLTA